MWRACSREKSGVADMFVEEEFGCIRDNEDCATIVAFLPCKHMIGPNPARRAAGYFVV